MTEIVSARGKAESLGPCRQLTVEMGWESDPGCDPAYELDPVAVLTNSGGHIRHRLDLVVYDSDNTISIDGEEHPCSYDESVIGPSAFADVEVGPGVGRQTVLVDLNKTDDRVKTIFFALCLYWDESDARDKRRWYHFGQLSNVYIALRDRASGKVLCRHVINPRMVNNCKGVELGKLYRRGDGWRFMATDKGLQNGWEDILDRYANGPLEALDF